MRKIVLAIGIFTLALTTIGYTHEWVYQQVPDTQEIFGVHFIDPDTGWAVGNYGTIFYTHDGGATGWDSIRISGFTTDLRDVKFLDSSHGWIVGLGGTVLRYTVEGDSFINESDPSVTTSPLWRCSFPDTLHGWAAGENGTIIHTSDGGRTWEKQDLSHLPGSATWWLKAIFFRDSLEGWATGKDGVILHTTDGGDYWERQWEGQTDHCLNSIVFPENNLEGWVGGRFGYIIHTTDGGENWEEQTYNYPYCLMGGVYMVDNKIGWGVGKYGRIVSTHDGGAGTSCEQYTQYPGPGWTIEINASDPPYNLRGLHAIRSPDHIDVWAVGVHGTILHAEISYPPSIEVAPDSLTLIIPLGETFYDTLTISNLGAGPLHFDISLSTDGETVRNTPVFWGETALADSPKDERLLEIPDSTLKSSPHRSSSGEVYEPKGRDVVLSEGFEGSFPPPGWSRIGYKWRKSDPLEYNHCGFYGALCEWGYDMDEWLITPTLSLGTGSRLEFWWMSSWYWHVDPNDNGDLFVQVSTDDGATWDTLWTFGDSASVVKSGGHWPWMNWVWQKAQIDLTAYSGDVLVAFRVVANDNADIAIDDVVVERVWLSVDPVKWTLPPSEQAEIQAKFTPDSSMTGDTVYTNEIHIYNNDPSNLEVIIPVRMMVTGVDVVAGPDTTGMAGDSLLVSFLVTNVGGVSDSYDLTVTDSLGWELSPSGLSLALEPAEDSLITVRVIIPSDASVGEVDWIKLTAVSQTNPRVSDFDFLTITVTEMAPQFIRGDANADMTVGMPDAVYILRYKFIPGSPPPSCMKTGDSDDDATVGMPDAVYILRYKFIPGEPPPPLPFPGCGPDPTPDELGCQSHPCMRKATISTGTDRSGGFTTSKKMLKLK